MPQKLHADSTHEHIGQQADHGHADRRFGVAPPVPEMLKAGLCVALGTDGASSNNNLNSPTVIRL